jgi:hypothetical protein
MSGFEWSFRGGTGAFMALNSTQNLRKILPKIAKMAFFGTKNGLFGANWREIAPS